MTTALPDLARERATRRVVARVHRRLAARVPSAARGRRRLAARVPSAGVALALFALALAAACGGPPAPAGPPATPAVATEPPGPEPTDAIPDAASSDTAAPPAGPPDDDECRALADHIVDIGMGRFDDAAPEVVPTEQQLAAIKAELAREFLPQCRALDRASYACAMRAATREEIAACASDPP